MGVVRENELVSRPHIVLFIKLDEGSILELSEIKL